MTSRDDHLRLRDVVAAGGVAAVLSGAPSTVWALATGGDPLAAARAAGVLLPIRPRGQGLVRGAIAHVGVSAVWSAALGVLARRTSLTVARGVAAGLTIAAVDLAVIGRRIPAIGALPQGPQWADHAAFGATFAWVLGRRRRSCG